MDIPHKQFQELQNPLKNYNLTNKLGSGKYGKVYQAIFQSPGQQKQQLAIKKMKLWKQQEEGIPYYILREISALKQLKHQNIIDLKDVIHSQEMIYLVMEYAESDLYKFISKFGGNKISIFQIQNIMKQLLTGLSYIHSKNICHRDIKPENILISPDGFIKISDFGLARYMNLMNKKLYTTEVVTQVYRAPELLLNMPQYDFKIDIWSCGCILAELILQDPIFAAETPLLTLKLIFQIMGEPNEEEWPQVQMNEMFQNLKQFQNCQRKNSFSFSPIEKVIGFDGIDLLIVIFDKQFLKYWYRKCQQLILQKELMHRKPWIMQIINVLFVFIKPFFNTWI